MRQPLFSLGILLALSLIVTGCNKDNKETSVADGNTPGTRSQTHSHVTPQMTVTSEGPTSHPSEETVKKFLTALLQGDTRGTVALLTPLAQAEFAKNSFSLNSLNSFKSGEFQDVKFRLTGSDLVSINDPNYFGVHVNTIINNDVDEPVPTVWLVRKFLDEYRVAGMMYYDDEDQRNIVIDFEGQVNPDGTPVQQQASTNQPAGQQPMTQQNPQVIQQTAQPNTPIFQ